MQIKELEKQRKALQEALCKEKNDLNKLFKSKDLLNRVTKETYSTILKISSLSQQCLNPKNENQLKLFLLLHAFLSDSLESHITEKSEALGVKAIIDEALVDEVVTS
jgi:hypothetical protein